MKKYLTYILILLGIVTVTYFLQKKPEETPVSFGAISAPTNITTAASGSSATSYTTASGAPTANCLQLLGVGSQVSSGTVNTPTVSGAGLTWVEIDNQISTDSRRKTTLFRALSATPSSGTLTIDFAGQSQIRAGWSWAEFCGVDTSGTNGSGAIVQSAKNQVNTGSSSTGITVTLGAFSGAGNFTYGFVRFNTLVGGAITVGSGFTEIGNVLSSVRYESEYKNSNDTTVDWTWGSETIFAEAIAVEIKEAAAASTAITSDLIIFE